MKYFELDSANTDLKRMKQEREKARKLKKTQWWLDQLNQGICYYCRKKVGSKALTMDHIVPLARGGVSTKGNLVPACRPCNENKKLSTPVDELLEKIAKKD